MRLTKLFLFALLGAGAVQPAMARERVAVGASFHHVFEQDADGQWRGLAVDVLRALAARAGDTVRFQLYPWPRAQAMVERGQADILIGPYKSAERLTRFAFLDLPFYRDRLVFYGRRQGPAAWNGDFRSLAGKGVAAVRGWHYGDRFDQARPLFDLSEVTQVDNGLQMLAVGRIDFLASNERNTTALIGQLHLGDRLTVLCPDIGIIDGYLAFALDPKFAPARRQYNTLFNQMVRSGELARLGAANDVLVPLGDAAEPPSACK
ncbi:MAG: transporter substrate-binding domain-containing protein [Duganella sp.]